MIAFLHPGFLYAAAAASALVVALHFLVAEQPKAGVLPTVRFFPDVDVRATTLAVRLSDILLLLLRATTLMLIGAAFAQPRTRPSRSAIVRIVAVDVSGSAASRREVADSAAKYTPSAGAIIAFDSIARETSGEDSDSLLSALRTDSAARTAGSLSSALVVALRAASRLRDRADSLDLVIVSPFLAEERDSATPAIRALWPGRIQLVRVGGIPFGTGTAAKTEWADSASSPVWSTRTKPDTVGALSFAGHAVIYPFERKWKLAEHDRSIRVTGRWVDGEPAIIERESSSGCTRSAAVTLPTRGDAILRTSFARLLRDASAPCYQDDRSPPTNETLAALSGAGNLAPTTRIAPEAARTTPLVPWLLGAALLLALLELPVRRLRARKPRDEADASVNVAAQDEREGKVA